MPYIGNQPGTGVRSRFIYTATASQTTFTGADDNGKTLKYADSAYVDVFLNGVCLVPGTDYTASTKTSIVLTQAASLNDTLEVVAYDIASMDDSISKSDGGTFNGDLGVTNASPDLTFTNSTSEDTDGGRESTVTFKGKQSGGEESTLAQIQASHDGTSDDEKGDLIFKTNDGSDGASPTEAMRIQSDQKIGIGTSSPSHLIDGRLSGTSSGEVISVGNTGTGVFGGIAVSDGGTYPVQHWGSSLEFHTGNSSYGSATKNASIDSSGNLLIGSDTTVGYGPLQIGSTSRSVTILQMLSSTSGDCGVHFGEGASGAARYRGYVTYSNSLDELYFGAADTTKMKLDGAGRAFIKTTNDNGAVLNIDNQFGDYCIGLRDSEENTAYALFLNSSNTATGSILRAGSSTTYNTTSDYRLKENIVDISNGIERVKQLAPKRFNFIEDPDRTVDGFLAHEAQAVVAEAVHGTKDAMKDEEYQVSAATGDVYTPATEEADEVIHSSNVEKPETLEEGQQWRQTSEAVMGTRSVPDYQGIDQAKIVPLLTAALKEAIAKIETLETKVAALEAE